MERTMMKMNSDKMNKSKRWMLGILITLFLLLGAAVLFRKIYHSKYLLFYNYEQKIWAHRVNSIPKLTEALTRFKGIEFDAVFLQDENDFDINHPPAKSIQLRLDKYFASVPNPNCYHFWIDFKNLTAENQQQSLSKLNMLAAKYKINKSNLIVESSNTEYLRAFTNSGFCTSYYLPYNLRSLNQDDLQIQIAQIKQQLDRNPSLAVSSNFRDYDLMKKYFPERDKLLWAPDGNADLMERKLIRNILKDGKVKALLIQFVAKHGNR